MEYRRLGRTNHQSSVIVFGGAALSSSDPDETAATIAEVRAAGINHFDTAACTWRRCAASTSTRCCAR